MRQRLTTMIIGLVGFGAIITLMLLSGQHEPLWLKWTLRAIVGACLIGVETMVLLYWARNPAPTRRHRSPVTAESENYPE